VTRVKWEDRIIGTVLKFLPDSTEKSTITLLLQGVDGLVGQSGTGALEGVIAGLEVDEAELEVQGRRERLQNTTTSLKFICQFLGSGIGVRSAGARATYRDDLPSDAVSGDETCTTPISLNSLGKPPSSSWVHTNAKSPSSSSHCDYCLRMLPGFVNSPSSELYILYAVQDYHLSGHSPGSGVKHAIPMFC
jgi:hypothetical protein